MPQRQPTSTPFVRCQHAKFPFKLGSLCPDATGQSRPLSGEPRGGPRAIRSASRMFDAGMMMMLVRTNDDAAVNGHLRHRQWCGRVVDGLRVTLRDALGIKLTYLNAVNPWPAARRSIPGGAAAFTPSLGTAAMDGPALSMLYIYSRQVDTW